MSHDETGKRIGLAFRALMDAEWQRDQHQRMKDLAASKPHTQGFDPAREEAKLKEAERRATEAWDVIVRQRTEDLVRWAIRNRHNLVNLLPNTTP